ncbi:MULTISPECIES: hypothetical protein [Clostridium]|jgi:hypothetical protein|uniref:hypothetical protein n=1 Tax=Clostridium TaxID=1485 RepID=UPI00115A763E|nr:MULTISPECIES: hypothetical protein [Clostridium]MCR1950854.1 hypothetical protein [Clostridium sp. DSM 100503]MDB1931827.1 hypothetical protein [Clostridium tertium]MDB1935451.1 hypothetical protein [Clostridium tertium]MDB1945549.1 hypothetical protein [Clostridium tertium]MDB1951258.1 hypothetical protein [Clostridium tertium]
MILKFRYNDNDYMELNYFINNERGAIKRGRIFNSVIYPLLLLILILSLVEILETYTIVPLIIWVIFTVVWVIFNKDIYRHMVNRTSKFIIKNPNLKGVDYFRDTVITLSDKGIKKEIEGICLNVTWESIEKAYVMEKNIFIRLVNATFINIPLRIFKSNEEKDNLLRYLDDHIKNDYVSID